VRREKANCEFKFALANALLLAESANSWAKR